MNALLESLSPGHLIRQSLCALYDELGAICKELTISELNEKIADKLTKIHSLLLIALDLRVEIESRNLGRRMRDLDFFEKVGLLYERGIDVRSRTWNTLVGFRAAWAHNVGDEATTFSAFVSQLGSLYKMDDL